VRIKREQRAFVNESKTKADGQAPQSVEINFLMAPLPIFAKEGSMLLGIIFAAVFLVLGGVAFAYLKKGEQ
jgi:hypothetical protein